MSNTPQNCVFKEIQMMKQNISQKHLSELLHNVYNNVIFSTFPYTLYKEEHSDICVYKYNSGNCIALSYFVKEYLQKNHNIKSYIIAASVPECYKIQGTPHLTHCSVLIPFSDYEFYIIDAAFYFLKPMYCNLKENIQRTIEVSNIYQHDIDHLNYIISKCDNCFLDKNYNQILKKNSLCVNCHFQDNESDHWNYYLNEIVNPDNNIGHSYLKHKNLPFMLYTTLKNKIPTLKYKLKVLEDGTIFIKKYPENEVAFNGNTENFDHTKIKGELQKYLSNDFSI